MPESVLLGDILSFSHRSNGDIEAWLANADQVLGDLVKRQSAIRGESVVQFVRIAVADFLAEASEEDWASLMSAARDAPDPGVACLAKMTAFRIAMEAVA